MNVGSESANDLIEALEVGTITTTLGKAAAIWDVLDTLQEATEQLDVSGVKVEYLTEKWLAVHRIRMARGSLEQVITALQHTIGALDTPQEQA